MTIFLLHQIMYHQDQVHRIIHGDDTDILTGTAAQLTQENLLTESTSGTSTTRTPDMMPLLGAKTAPAKFQGKYDTVKSFVNEDWDQLEKDILTYYDTELHESHYLLSDLDKLVECWRKKGIYNLTRFKRYEVEFLTMVNWLLHKGKITLDEQHMKFWYGLNGNLCKIVEARYLTSHPCYDPRRVITCEDMAKIVYSMFTRNQFDADLTAKKSKDRRAKLEELLKMSMSGDEDMETGSSKDSTSTSDSESDSKHRKTRKKKGAKHHKPLTKTKKSKCTSHKKASSDETSSKSSSSESEMEEEPRAKKKKETRTGWKETLKEQGKVIPKKGKAPESRNTDEVEELVDKLAKMKITLKRDAAIANIVAPPAKQTLGPENPLSCNNSRMERHPSRDTLHNMYCFGCGKDDHMLRQCFMINERVEKGHITKDEYGRLTHKDGTYIWQIGTETFEDAIRRTTMSSNLVTINMFQANTDSENEDEAYADYFQMSEETDINEEYNNDAYAYSELVSVNAATRETSETRSRVKDRQNGVTKGFTKAAATNPYGTRLNPNKNLSSEVQRGAGTRPSKKDSPLPSEPIPVDARPSRIQETSDLEDVEMEEMRPSIVGLMKTVLSAPVTIPIGEFMAYSAELRKQLIKELQNCTMKFSETGKTDMENVNPNVAQVNLVTMEPICTKPLICSPLLTIEVDVGSETKKIRARAIVDSGSEINIMCQELAHEVNKLYPITPLKEIRTYLVYHDPQNEANFKELFVLEESWGKESAKMASAQLVEAGEIRALGSWTIDSSQEIIILGEPKKYTSCVLAVYEEPKYDNRIESHPPKSSEDLTDRTKGKQAGSRLKRRPEHRNRLLETPAVKKIR
ncbi:hypothetical protein EDD85DRAFT_787680 [Armillaria nabsnona]|nr:hypothetical protein EDD85DRAFT_787680 [Armillaria nabsnona]